MLQPWVYLVILLVIMVGVFYFINKRNQAKKLAKFKDVFVALFWTNTGAKFYYCKEQHGEVILPEEYSGVDTKTITGFFKYKNPKTDVEEKYYIQPQFKQPILWPPEKKRKDQVELGITVYYPGIPLPIIGVMCEKWTSEMLSTLASTLIQLSSDENTLRAFQAQDSNFWNNIEYLRKQIQKLGTIQIASFVSAGAAALAMFLVWQLTGKLDTLLKALGG